MPWGARRGAGGERRGRGPGGPLRAAENVQQGPRRTPRTRPDRTRSRTSVQTSSRERSWSPCGSSSWLTTSMSMQSHPRSRRNRANPSGLSAGPEKRCRTSGRDRDCPGERFLFEGQGRRPRPGGPCSPGARLSGFGGVLSDPSGRWGGLGPGGRRGGGSRGRRGCNVSGVLWGCRQGRGTSGSGSGPSRSTTAHWPRKA